METKKITEEREGELKRVVGVRERGRVRESVCV
jgi:hypothetical protein